MSRTAAWVGALGVVAACVLLPGVRFARIFWTEYASFCAPRAAVDTPAAAARVPGLRPVAWTGPAGAVRGWYAPGTNRGAVILMHGSMGSRGDVIAETELLARRGFSVLAFDWPGHGESGGCVRWDEAERATLGTAIDWLAHQPEVRADRIGAFAFSAGTYTLIQRAARDRRIRAVAVAGASGDAMEYARWEYRAFGPKPQWPALLAMRARGMHPDEQVPNDVIREIAPRPLLVIYGEDDGNVPPYMSIRLFEAAVEPKQLLKVPAASHGDYAKVAPELYGERLTSFFAAALLSERTAAHAE